jgi:hypothetical protein
MSVLGFSTVALTSDGNAVLPRAVKKRFSGKEKAKNNEFENQARI